METATVRSSHGFQSLWRLRAPPLPRQQSVRVIGRGGASSSVRAAGWLTVPVAQLACDWSEGSVSRCRSRPLTSLSSSSSALWALSPPPPERHKTSCYHGHNMTTCNVIPPYFLSVVSTISNSSRRHLPEDPDCSGGLNLWGRAYVPRRCWRHSPPRCWWAEPLPSWSVVRKPEPYGETWEASTESPRTPPPGRTGR